jgi:hypothetical protein
MLRNSRPPEQQADEKRELAHLVSARIQNIII